MVVPALRQGVTAVSCCHQDALVQGSRAAGAGPRNLLVVVIVRAVPILHHVLHGQVIVFLIRLGGVLIDGARFDLQGIS